MGKIGIGQRVQYDGASWQIVARDHSQDGQICAVLQKLNEPNKGQRLSVPVAALQRRYEES